MNFPNKKDIFLGLRGKVRRNVPLKKYTTFKIGGAAKFFIEPRDTADLKSLISAARRYKIPILVMGLGSNILVSDREVKAIVLRLSSPFFRRLRFKKNYLEAASGAALKELILAARERSLGGLEFLTGIPGTVGGALAMNAGAWGESIADLVENARVMDYNAKIKNLDKKDIKFEYRKSSLAKYIILGVRLKLAKSNKAEINNNIRRFLQERRRRQDTSFPNAGCIFKNTPEAPAGRLIDLCGFKGKRFGGACVSARHANFILNLKNASADDVLKLMNSIKKTVKNKFKVALEPEIKIWQ